MHIITIAIVKMQSILKSHVESSMHVSEPDATYYKKLKLEPIKVPSPMHNVLERTTEAMEVLENHVCNDDHPSTHSIK